MSTAMDAITASHESPQCPLCDYDLRATTEPRCPECGYAFDWAELRDPARRLHPYAFEHHPERSVTSFIRTFFAGLRPKRFWRTLYPTQPSRPGRLILYWMLVTAACLALPIVQGAREWPLIESELRGARNNMTATLARSPESFGESAKSYPTSQAYIDAHWPVPTASTILDALAGYDLTVRTFALASAFFLVWPWLTFMALMIFQFSMRRARIKPIHVLRAVVYTSDVALWASAAMFAAIGYEVMQTGWVGTGRWRGWSLLTNSVLLIVALTFLVYTWRLAAAYRHYLRFPHALATAFSVQLMILLLLAYIATEWDVIRL